MEVRVLLPQPNGAWDCVAWSSPWQGEIQAGLSALAPLRGATADAIDSLRRSKLGLTPAPGGAPLRVALPRCTRRLHHFHGSQALTVKPPALNRQNPEHYRGGLPFGSVAQQSAQLPHKEKVAGANPA